MWLAGGSKASGAEFLHCGHYHVLDGMEVPGMLDILQCPGQSPKRAAPCKMPLVPNKKYCRRALVAGGVE